MKAITKVKLHNFKKFMDFEVPLNEKRNIFIGENESGKSSILSAIALTLGGNRPQIENLGMERLINQNKVQEFLDSEKQYEDLPKMFVELWLNEQNNHELFGRNNSEEVDFDGLRMECVPDDNFSREVREILERPDANFPFEFYQVRFTTFQGDAYSGYKKYLRHILIDTSQIGNDYAVRKYVGDMYRTYASDVEVIRHQNEYRKVKAEFQQVRLGELNDRVPDYSFGLRTDNKSNLKNDLTLLEEEIAVENKGKGKQCFIKTEFALKKAEGVRNKMDVALIEEPENHLSHINMKKLIAMIDATDDKQLIIATHSNLISSRLDLRNTILLHSSSDNPVLLAELPKDTASFFVKVPYHNILDYVLSRKVLLVEGDAEYILMEKLYRIVTGRDPDEDDVHIYSVGGTSFKRYLDVANLLNIQTGVIRDNDGNYESNCITLYEDYADGNSRVFADTNDGRSTLEICLYEDNRDFFEGLFAGGRRTLTVQDWMLKNKAEAALRTLEGIPGDFQVPQYISDAIEWISA